MPALTLSVDQKFSPEEKRAIATAISAAVHRGLELAKVPKNPRRVLLTFQYIDPEDVAIDGTLVSEGAMFPYKLEYNGLALTDEQKVVVTNELTRAIVEALGLPQDEGGYSSVSVLYVPYGPTDYAIGGRFFQAWDRQYGARILELITRKRERF